MPCECKNVHVLSLALLERVSQSASLAEWSSFEGIPFRDFKNKVDSSKSKLNDSLWWIGKPSKRPSFLSAFTDCQIVAHYWNISFLLLLMLFTVIYLLCFNSIAKPRAHAYYLLRIRNSMLLFVSRDTSIIFVVRAHQLDEMFIFRWSASTWFQIFIIYFMVIRCVCIKVIWDKVNFSAKQVKEKSALQRCRW